MEYYQRRRVWQRKWFYGIVIIIIGLFLLGYCVNLWLNIDEDSQIDSENKSKETQKNTLVNMRTETEEWEQREEEAIPEKGAIYLLKESGDCIALYREEQDGTEVKLRDTEIQYSLLTGEDQLLFQGGISFETKEELNEFLQDFES